jgi:hypothetical protein
MEQRANLKKEYLQGSLTIMRKTVKKRYIKISNDFLRKYDLSFRARGLNAYILSKQDNWKVIISHIANFHNKGECYVSTARNELIKAGYWHYKRERKDSGEYDKGVTLVFDESKESVAAKYFKGEKKVFRTDSDSDFTLLTCDHLDDSRLSLISKGILSYILTQPNNWKFDIDDLVEKGTEGIGTIREEVNLLIKCGYIQRFRIYKDGVLTGNQMIASEEPFNEHERIKSVLYFNNKIKINFENGRNEVVFISNKQEDNNDCNNNINETEKPAVSEQNCTSDLFNENLDVVNIDNVNPDLSIINNLINTNKNNLSLYKNNKKDDFISYSKSNIKKQIEYDILVQEFSKTYLDPIVNAMYKVLNCRDKHIRIAKVYYLADGVKEVFKSINAIDVDFFIKSFLSVKKEVGNLSEYIKSALYNNYINLDLSMRNKVNAYSDDILDKEECGEDEGFSKYKNAEFKKTPENSDDLIGDFVVEEDIDIFSNFSDFLKEINDDELSNNDSLENNNTHNDLEANKDDLSEEVSEATSYWEEYKKSLSSGKMLFLDTFVKEVEVVNGELFIHPKNSYKDKVKYELERKYLEDIKEFFKENYRIKECYIR